jgi:hypothetical protein
MAALESVVAQPDDVDEHLVQRPAVEHRRDRLSSRARSPRRRPQERLSGSDEHGGFSCAP